MKTLVKPDTGMTYLNNYNSEKVQYLNKDFDIKKTLEKEKNKEIDKRRHKMSSNIKCLEIISTKNYLFIKNIL